MIAVVSLLKRLSCINMVDILYYIIEIAYEFEIARLAKAG